MVPAAGGAAIFNALFGTAVLATSTAAIITTIIVNLAISAILGKILAPNAPKSSTDTKGLQNIIKSNIAPRRIIYGEAITGGPYALVETGGPTNQWLNMIVVLAGHPVEDIIGVLINEQYVDISGDAGSNDLDLSYYLKEGKYGTGAAAEHVKIIKNNGWGFADHQYVTDGAGPDAGKDRSRGIAIANALNAVNANSNWTQPATITRDSGTGLYTDSGHKLTNCAHIFIGTKFNRDIWSGFPTLKFHVKGKRLYNPALGQDINDPDTFLYSEDWTLCILDYLMNTSYGLGAKTSGILSEIDWTEAIQSYNDSSELIPSVETPDVAARYTINGILETNSTPISNMEALLTSGSGSLIYAQGKYKLRPGVYRAPNSANDIINEDMMVSPLSIQTHTPRSELFNKAAGIFVDRGYTGSPPYTGDNIPKFEPSDFKIVDPLDSGGVNPYELIDDEEIIREFDFPFTTQEYEAQRLARIQLERVRQGLTVSFEANLKVLKYSVGDTVYLEILNNSKYANESFYNRLGLDDLVQDDPDDNPYYKQFKIIDMQYTDKFTISVAMIEESEEIYDWNHGFANLTDHALISEIIADDPTGEVLAPSFVVNSPYLTLEENIGSAGGTTVTTLIRWSSADRGSLTNVVDRSGISYYKLEYGIVDNPGESSAVNRVSTWITAGNKTSDHNTIEQGPIALETLYKDGAEYDFRISAVAYSGRSSVWAYYSEDIGLDYSPTAAASSAGNDGYYIKPINGTVIRNGTGTLTVEAHQIIAGVDSIISSGSRQLYVNGTTVVTVANGYASPSDGYTGSFDETNIGGNVVVELRDGSGGTILDTITLVDIDDGLTAQVLSTQDWVIPIADTMGTWSRVTGVGNITTHNDVPGPFFEYPTVMRIVGNNTNQGWFGQYKGTHTYDINKSYVYYTWVRKIGTPASGLYLGFNTATAGSERVQNIGGSPNTNPYFVSNLGGSTLTIDKWYLAVGIIYANGFGGSDQGLAGIYDPTDGARVYNGAEFEWHQQLSDAYIRLGFYDNAGPVIPPTDGFEFTRVTAWVRDGAEPSIEAVLGAGAVQPSYAYIEATNGLAWVQEIDDGDWNPAATSTNLDVTVVKRGVDVARWSRQIDRDAAGLLTDGGAATHTLGTNLNTQNITPSITGTGSQALTVKYDYVNNLDIVSVAETVITAIGGSAGSGGTASLIPGTRMTSLGDWYGNSGQQIPLNENWSVETVNGPVGTLGFRVLDNNDDTEFLFSERATIDASKKHRVSVWAQQPSGDRFNYLAVCFYDVAGVEIQGSLGDSANWPGLGTFNYWGVVNTAISSNWTKYAFEFGGDATATIPTGAVSLAIGGLFTRDGAAGTETTVYLQDYFVVEIGAGGVDGSDGTDARAVNLTTGIQAFKYYSDNTLNDAANTTITATALNTISTPYYEFFEDDDPKQNTTTNTYTYTPEASFLNMPDKIEVYLREGGTGGPVYARDQITISGTKPGVDAPLIVQTNEAHTIPVTNTGTHDYTGSGNTIEVYLGTTKLAYDSAPAYASPSFRVTSATPTNITVGTPTENVNDITYGNASAMTQDTAYIVYTIVVKNTEGIETTITRVQSFARSVEGADGATGNTGADGNDGADGLSSALTNPNVVVVTWADGTNYSYTGTGGTHKVYEGATDKTTTAVHSVFGSATKNGLTMSVVSGTGVYSLSGASWTSDSEQFTLRAVYATLNFDKIYTITKNKIGGVSIGSPPATVDLTDITGGPGFAENHYRVSSDGYLYEAEGTSTYTQKEQWIGDGASSDYEVGIFVALTGGQDPPTGSQDEVWIPVTSDITWTWNISSDIVLFNGYVMYRRRADNIKIGETHITVESDDT